MLDNKGSGDHFGSSWSHKLHHFLTISGDFWFQKWIWLWVMKSPKCCSFWGEKLLGYGYRQSQSQLQVKLSLKTELALFSCNPATHPPPDPHPPTHPTPPTPTHPPGKVYFPTFLSECWPSKVTVVGRWPQSFVKWKTTSIFLKIEDDFNYFENGRRPQLWAKSKTTSIVWQKWRQPQFIGKLEDNMI
jgi:hypothetical protein